MLASGMINKSNVSDDICFLALFLLFGTSILDLPAHNYLYYLCKGRDEPSSSGPKSKACREKIRRDRLNDRCRKTYH
jgi:hypothetical protein